MPTSQKTRQVSTNDPVTGRTPSSPLKPSTPSNARPPVDSKHRASAFTALSARHWQCVHLARRKHNTSNQTSAISISTFGANANLIPHLGLPARSFRNHIHTLVTELDSVTLAHSPLCEFANVVNGHIRHVSTHDTFNLGRCIVAQPDKSKMKLDFNATPGLFITSGWYHFTLYDGAALGVPTTFVSPVSPGPPFDVMVFFVESSRGVEMGVLVP
ncbi:hypothetical protein BU24DRAFT_480536 [Aaosphaeria arxii CBS 175.79]|uniref:Uncharacterized protein n=1 Tax=Aaosphaeria arxii CBS 175.79 TaxID=1450172 RepID=A0A6A5XSA5_9PLEO|nr:uncharacterized protein BU24DRAFT_480536 [Aaosphaeria arxii CBS 175.79]KAF2015823.1 hypothetical protein BU24DRAFT_480536 [Aaosphaeria arxii CBS 175.79]